MKRLLALAVVVALVALPCAPIEARPVGKTVTQFPGVFAVRCFIAAGYDAHEVPCKDYNEMVRAGACIVAGPVVKHGSHAGLWRNEKIPAFIFLCET